MFIWLFLFFISVILLPSTVFAWGPVTHIYLGSEVYFMGAAISPSIYALLRKFRQDYLYGNIMADIIFAKKYLPREKNPHNWDVALELLDAAETEPERAFVLGYMSHLAADTVAHTRYTKGRKNLSHSILELQAESLIDRHYWFLALSIGEDVQKRGDILLKRCLESPFFSFKTNKRILKGIVLMSGLRHAGSQKLFYSAAPDPKLIEGLHEESLDRMLDVLEKGRRSRVLK